MKACKQLALRSCPLVLATAALAVWLALSHGGGPAQSTGQLSIAISDDADPIALGGAVTYTITVENTGASAEHGVVVSDSLIGPGTIQAATPSKGTCDPPAPTAVTCNLGTLQPGETATVTVAKRATMPVGGTTELLVQKADAPAAANGSDGLSPPYTAIAGAVALAVAISGGWYARRRWLR